MGKLTTHVLDTTSGAPAAGMAVALLRLDGDRPAPLKRIRLNHDGRADSPLLADAELLPGRYRLVFAVAEYFRARGVDLPDPPFLDVVPVRFAVAEAEGNYHVPLVTTPWSYSTYRGS